MRPPLSSDVPLLPQPAPAAAGYARLAVAQVRAGQRRQGFDNVAEEAPVALVYNDQPFVVMMATPLDLSDFALGFSLSEGLIESPAELLSLRVTPLGEDAAQGLQIDLQVPLVRQHALAARRRNLDGRSGCGLCGAQSIESAIRPPRRVPAGAVVEDAALRRALASLRERQLINAETGATHAAAWADVDGRIDFVREDVGRHNALDKLIGALAARGQAFSAGFIVVTSRASYEMVLKAASVGVPLIAAISAPTTLAVRLAEDAGMTLVGFARGDAYTVYACPARLPAPTVTDLH